MSNHSGANENVRRASAAAAWCPPEPTDREAFRSYWPHRGIPIIREALRALLAVMRGRP